MTIVRDWYEALESEAAELVRKLVYVEQPSDEQLQELPDLAADYGIAALELGDAERAKLEKAIDELDKQLNNADPRHKFLRMHDGIEVGPKLLDFFRADKPAALEGCYLEGTNYAPDKLFVDFDAIANLENPDFVAEMIGRQYVVFANLAAGPSADAGECYAHLVIDPIATTVYLVEPSGDPELIAEDLDALLQRIRVTVD